MEKERCSLQEKRKKFLAFLMFMLITLDRKPFEGQKKDPAKNRQKKKQKSRIAMLQSKKERRYLSSLFLLLIQ